MHVCGLASLGISSEQYSNLLIPIIMPKIPSDICLEIARKAMNNAWKIDDLLKTITFEIEAREVTEATRSTKRGPPNKQDKGVKQNIPTANSLLAGTRDGERQSPTVNDHKTILKNSGRCFRCLYKGHHVRDCKGPRL